MYVGRTGTIIGGQITGEADTDGLDFRLLGVRRNRPRNRRTVEKRDELAPPHVQPQAEETAF